MKNRLAPIAIALLLVSAVARAQSGPDNDPDAAPGYVNSVFHHGQVDSINLYNGQLTVPIPIGPTYSVGPKLKVQLVMTYNSQVSGYGHPYGLTDNRFSYAPIVGDSALGIGWTFTLGAIKTCRVGQDTGNCYFSPDGSSHMFSTSSTLDGTQYRLQGSGPFDMWDSDGTHYVFGHQVSGYDDSLLAEPGYVRDFGIGRDGWYLSSATDSFGNTYSVGYGALAAPLWSYELVGCTGAYSTQMRAVGSGSWVPSSISLPGMRSITIAQDPSSRSISSFSFPVSVAGSASTAVWTLQYYTPQQLITPCYSSATNTIDIRQLQAIQFPSSLGSYQFAYTTNLLSQLTLPTGATLSYCYSTYTFFHGRLGALSTNCSTSVPSGQIVEGANAGSCATGSCPNGGNGMNRLPPFGTNLSPACDGSNELRYSDPVTGVVKRTETQAGVCASTTYTQYSFPYGERGQDGMGQEPQSLTVVVFPPDIDGRSSAKAVLFQAAPKGSQVAPGTPVRAGDRVGSDIEERVFSSDPNATALISMPACGVAGSEQKFCGSQALRVTQRSYDYDIPTSDVSNRRLLKESIFFKGLDPAGTCVSCPFHATTYSLTGSNTWQGNGRHYDKESHTGEAGTSSDTRTMTTFWSPKNWTTFGVANPPLPNVSTERVESDSTSTSEHFFDFDPNTGFLRGSAALDATTSMAVFNCRYPDPSHPGDAKTEVTVTVPTGSVAPGFCSSGTYSSMPTASVGTNNDMFGKQHVYQNGLRLRTNWLYSSAGSNLSIGWYGFDVDRDLQAGWISAMRDTAGVATSYQYDALGRVTRIAPVAGEDPTFVCYDTTTRTTAYRAPSQIGSCPSTSASGTDTWQQYLYDSLGRTAREIRSMPGGGYAFRTHGFDGAGHSTFDSEWGSCTNAATDCTTAVALGTLSHNFDAIGRPTLIVRADYSTTNLSYVDSLGRLSDRFHAMTENNISGFCSGMPCFGGIATATTTYVTDDFGRLTKVTEPAPTGDTTYTYNIDKKLTGVTQVGTGQTETRTFAYDRLGLLRSETTPERGPVLYTGYGSLGNVVHKTESDMTTFAFAYDAACRLLSESAGGTVYVTNCFDGTGVNGAAGGLCPGGTPNFAGGTSPRGKLTERIGLNTGFTSPPTVTDIFTYSGLAGRLSAQGTTISGGPGEADQSWFYNSIGQVAQYAHPRVGSASAPLVESTIFSAGLPTGVYANGLPVVAGVTYAPSGALKSYTTGLFTGKTVTTTITPDASGLARPGSIATSGAVGQSFGAYTYDGVGNITVFGADTFSYDDRSRLLTASLSGLGIGTYSASYSYDRFGNLLTKAGTTLCTTTCINNRLPSGIYGYDGRGNLTSSPSETYTYDFLDRTTTVSSGWKYGYDGAGERVIKIPPPTGSPTYTYRDAEGRVATEYSGSSPSIDNIFLGNQIVGSFANGLVTGNTRVWAFYTSDHLGTPRLLTDMAGTSFETRRYAPWGEQLTTGSPLERVRFAAMEKDPEAGAGNDRYFDHARQHGAGLGRFLSPDETPGEPEGPQSWNRYEYSSNNPLGLVDPDGRAVKAPDYLVPIFARFAAVRSSVHDYLERTGNGILHGPADAVMSVVLPTFGETFVLPVPDLIPLIPESAAGTLGADAGTNFVVTQGGDTVPIPNGATGPTDPQFGEGQVYQGGSGGRDMNSRTTGVRIMDANGRQGPRVNYMNERGQTIDPKTGRTIQPNDPRGHIPLKPNPPAPAKPACTTTDVACPKSK